jgi:hypothetical protein
MKGSYLSASELDIIEFANRAYSYENVGIAAVTPSYFLKDILQGVEY